MSNFQEDFLETFASMRGGVVVGSDVAQLVAGISSAGLLGYMTFLKMSAKIHDLAAALLAIILGILFFLVIEWIQSKSWATAFDEWFKNKVFAGKFSMVTWYRLILNVVILIISIACAGVSVSTSYWASQDAGDAMVQDATEIDFAGMAMQSMKLRHNADSSSTASINELKNKISALESGIEGKKKAARRSLGKEVERLAKRPNDQWATKEIAKAEAAAERKERDLINSLSIKLERMERQKNETLRSTTENDNNTLRVISSNHNKQVEKIEAKEERNTYMFAFLCVGSTFFFVGFQLVLGLDRGITGMDYQTQRQYAPESFSMVSQWFDPEYRTRGRFKKKRGSYRASGTGRKASGTSRTQYQPKKKKDSTLKRIFKGMGIKTEDELYGRDQLQTGQTIDLNDEEAGEENEHPVHDQTGSSWQTNSADNRRSLVMMKWEELQDAKGGGKPTIREMVNATGIPESSVKRYLKSLRDEGSI